MYILRMYPAVTATGIFAAKFAVVIRSGHDIVMTVMTTANMAVLTVHPN